jgi:L-ascorbate metabolism protein UlaG (beta-lactamase superfamily)
MATDVQRAGLRNERVRASKQFRDGRFVNTSGVGTQLQGSKLAVMGEFFFRKGQRVPSLRLPIEKPHEHWASSPHRTLRTTWLGHSTVLLEQDGKRILTDPVFGQRASPLSFAGPKRFHPVPATLAELPKLDVVVLSHDHFDHLCSESIATLARMNVPIVTSLGVGADLEKFGFNPALVHELDWHQSIELNGVKITATPSQHFSGRGPLRNRTLWSSWVIQTETRKTFFSGDTGLTDEFIEIGKTYGPFDLVMLEVGAFHPSWGTIHLGPANALKAFAMLGGGTLLPVHWGTFNLGLHDWNEPAETLLTLAATSGQRIVTPRLGQVFEPELVEGATPWWQF